MPKTRPWLHPPATCTVCPFSRRAETGDSAFHMHGPGLRAVRMKASGKVARVERGSVGRDLQVHAEIDAVYEELERPLVLLVRPRRAQRHERPAVLQNQRWAQRRAGADQQDQ